MGEVIYSINGHYFKDYGVYVSDSQGIMDALVRKPTKSYNWHEYHGESVDLSEPKFEAREISLSCFIDGENYEQMFLSFQDFIVEQFQKSGTQRLMIEPFGYKPLVYEVYMKEGVKLDKTFKEGKMVGIFEIKLIEPNPIKKVLYLTENTLNLSYNSSKETEIFFVNGEKTTTRGNVSLSGKTLANRVVSGYNFNGRNLILNSEQPDWNPNNVGFGTSVKMEDATGKFTRITPNADKSVSVFGQYFEESNLGGYSRSIWIRPLGKSVTLTNWGNKVVPADIWSELKQDGYTDIGAYQYLIFSSADYGITIDTKKLKFEKGNKASDWSPAPEDEKYIIIAGDINGITNLTTNAEVLWEKL